jgi:hypothetical protein
MSKKLILGLALAVVLVSGLFVNAQAQGCFSCLPHISMPSCLSCQAPDRDYDRPSGTCQGAYQFGPSTPAIMGSPGV